MSARLGNIGGRAVHPVGETGWVDVARASGGRLPSDPMQVIGEWQAFLDWSAGVSSGAVEGEWKLEDLGPPVPRPGKVFGIGLNYRDHAEEAGLPIPQEPLVFTKFPNCLAGPGADVELSSAHVDWEVELVVVIGRGGRAIPADRALDHVAGLCVGQDISDRKAQFAGTPPQFSMGKSYDTYGPIGPFLTSAVGLDASDLGLTCRIDDEVVQDGSTRHMIFGVAELVAFLSRRLTLAPGDLIFTGTPAGVGSTRNPRRYLREGQIITSCIEPIGSLVNRCVAGNQGAT